MIKRITLVYLVVMSLNGFTQYCTSGGPTSTVDSDLGAITLNGETQNINIAATCPGTLGVEDLTATQTADLLADSTYTISVDFNTCGGNYSNASEVWIDYNLNNSFESNESVGSWQGTAPSGNQLLNFTVPSWVCNGVTRIRIMQHEGGALPLNPCANFTWGSVVDAEVSLSGGSCQIAGCTDSTSLNYNPLATIDDGSCLSPAGKNCDTAHIINSLPFSGTNMSTFLYGNNYNSTHACGSSYMDGNDYVFEYTTSVSECVTISINNADVNAGLFVLDGCPDSPGTNCVSQSNGASASINPILAPGTYYIVVSNDPAFGGPMSTIFDININSTAVGGAGTSCSNPHVINGSYSQTGLTTSCYGNDYNFTMACNSNNMNGNDYVFEYTPLSDTCVTINIENAAFSTGLFLLDGCPDNLNTDCIASSTGSSSQIFKKTVNAGQTYYVIVSTDGSPFSTNFDITITEEGCPVPTVQDCLGAIPLCGHVYSSPNGASYQGIGEFVNEFSTDNTCFGTGVGMPQGEPEVNSVWYTFTTVGNGNLGFTITPDTPVDYDWAVFDITGPNHSCQTMYQDGAISCNWSGSLGINGTGVTGPNGGNDATEEPLISVLAGNTYAIVVTDYAASGVPMTIEFDTTFGTIGEGVIDFTFGISGLDLTVVGTSDCADLLDSNVLWTSNGQIIGSGNSLDYSFAEAGTYEVCMIVESYGYSDTTCQTIFIGQNSGYEFVTSVEVYPNPTKNKLRINMQEFYGEVRIMDLAGSLIYRDRLSSGVNILDLSRINSGIYYYEIENEEGSKKIDKLIVK